jgi:integrase
LCAYYDSRHQLSYVKSTFITNGLRHAAGTLEQFTGIDCFLLSAHSLRPGGATALLCAGIDSDVIKLLGRWKSDAMFRYLRIQVHIHQSNIAQRMLNHGSYTFAPGKFVAAADMPLPCETPRAFADVITPYEIND